MLNPYSIIFGFLSALSFGIGDFSGGFVTKKINVLLVLLYSQITGLMFLIVSILLIGEVLDVNAIPFGLLSGIFGGIGLLAFYRGLSLGNMKIVAPITSVITPITPLVFSLLSLDYTTNQIIGILLALIAIWLVSSSKVEEKVTYLDIILAVVAGIGFGFFLLFIDFASSQTSVLYPIVFARISSIIMTICILAMTGNFKILDRKPITIISIVGILDTVGNLFFIFSSKAGRVDFSSIILSLGPVITVILAWRILKENISKTQVLGIILSVFAISLLSS